jgi:PKD repeat protein
MSRSANRIVLSAALAVALAAGGCSVKDTQAPPLTGPSELGVSLGVIATPDVLTQDGASQSQIVVEARGPNGEPLRDRAVRLEITVNGTVVDFGRLSSRDLTTGADGRATTSYTAPPAPADPVDTGTVVVIRAVPAGTNYATAVPRSVEIRLVPAGVILPPAGTPRARFAFAPSSPIEGEEVRFDASGSLDCPPGVTDEKACAPGGSTLTYSWSFGDGGGGQGASVSRWYWLGTYTVTLTVQNDRGRSDSTSKFVTVGSSTNPTASFNSSPSDPQVGQAVFFNASASRSAPGRTLVRYSWTFGDGGSGSGVNTSHTYAAPGTYTVNLNVTDDMGKSHSVSGTVTVR